MKCLNLSNPLFNPILKRKYQNRICSNNHYIPPKKYYFNNSLTFFGNNFHSEIESNIIIDYNYQPCECKIKTTQNINYDIIDYQPCECKIKTTQNIIYDIIDYQPCECKIVSTKAINVI